jgi:hypothetical protein
LIKIVFLGTISSLRPSILSLKILLLSFLVYQRLGVLGQMRSAGLVLAILALLGLHSTSATLSLYLFTDAQRSALNARCLDGSSSGFYYEAGSGSGASNWVIFFQGGGECHTQSDCTARASMCFPLSSDVVAAADLIH